MAENMPRNEAMLAKILLNQRTILEQNKKILEERVQQREEERQRDSSNDKIPLIVQVYFDWFLFLLHKKQVVDRYPVYLNREIGQVYSFSRKRSDIQQRV
jgi:hypothetical protein